MNAPGDTVWPAGWYPDPLDRFEFRWFNGLGWTADVSVDGRRFIDAGERPTRTLAVLTLIFGSVGLLLAWLPLLFVVGVGCAITAIILGVIALRRAGRGRALGRGMAVGGIVSAVAAMAVCPVGVVLTLAVIDELERSADPGPHRVSLGTCVAEGRRITVRGTVDNLDDRAHDYMIGVRISDRGGHLTTVRVPADDVGSGQRHQWELVRAVDRVDATSVSCELTEVTGPNPFGLDAL